MLHFNHGFRPESAQEEQFVKALCESLELPFFVRHGNPKSLKTSKLGMQAAAREWRRAEANELLRKLEDDEQGVILLAHHADDQVAFRS